MTQTLRGKTIWITGGGSGIGRAIALESARQGANVAVSGRRKDRLDSVVAEVERAGAPGLAVVCDVSDESQIESAVQTVVEKFGKLDIAIANAGYAVSGRVEDLTAEDLRRQLEINVVGLAMTAKHALGALRESGGRVVLVGSVSAYLNAPKNAAYQASKHAVRAIGETLSIELKGSGTSCTTVHPGFVESEIAQVDNQGQHHPDAKDKRPAFLMWKSDKAARTILKAAMRRKREHIFTYHGKAAVFLARHFPTLIYLVLKAPAAKKSQPPQQA